MRATILVSLSIFLAGCSRAPQSSGPAFPPPEPLKQAAAEPLPDSFSTGALFLEPGFTGRHWGLSLIADAKGFNGCTHLLYRKYRLWDSYIFDALDAVTGSGRAQEEQNKAFAELQKLSEQKGRELQEDLEIVASVKPSAEAMSLDKEAFLLVEKWYARFPDSFPDSSLGPPVKVDVLQMDKEAGAIIKRLEKMPRIAHEQLEAQRLRIPVRAKGTR